MALNRQKVDLLNEEITENLVPQLGIQELNNVAIDNTTLTNQDVIAYDSTGGNWSNLCLKDVLASIAYTGKWSDLKNTPTTIAGYGITNAYTKAEVDSKVASTFRYKGTKTNYTDLPTTGQQVGDVWNIVNAYPAKKIKAGDNVCWTGTDWDVLAGTTDLSNYYTKPEVDTKVTNLENKKANKADISAVGYSGNYSDIISRPTKLSDLTDDTDVNPVKKATVAIAIGFASAGSGINPIYIDNNGIPKASTSTVGSSIKPVYLNAGTITASNANVGTVINPIYIENGEIKASNSNLNLDGNKLLSMVSGSLKESSRTIGANNKPVYLNAGSINEVNLNSTIKNLLANISTDSSAIVDTDYGFITNNDTTSATSVRKPISKFVDYFRKKLSITTTGSGDLLSSVSYNNTTGVITNNKYTGTVGSGVKPIYMSSGTITASSSTVGSGVKPVYLNSGTITVSSSTVGGTKVPVYLNAGTITSCGKQLQLKGTTTSSNVINADNPSLEFSNSDRSQYCQLIYSDYDAILPPDSLTLVGNQDGTYFIAPNIKATGKFYGNLVGNADTATKVGTATVGSGIKPIYLNAGTATAISATVGSTSKPVYLNAGTITECTAMPTITSSTIEFKPSSTAGNGGFIDFHYNGSTDDYTSRIIESAKGTLKLNSVTINGSTITGNLSGNVTGNVTGNSSTATKLATARTIAISGGATGTATSFDGSANITIPVTSLNASKLDTNTVPSLNATKINGVTVGSSPKFTDTTYTAGSGISISNGNIISSLGSEKLTLSAGDNIKIEDYIDYETFTYKDGVTYKYSELQSTYMKRKGQEGFNSKYDSNKDDVVNSADLTIFKQMAKESKGTSYKISTLSDTTPTDSSTKLIQSGGVYTALSGKANTSGTYPGLNVGTAGNAGSANGLSDDCYCIEFNRNGTLANYGGFIDFHYNGSTADYTSRIIETSNGTLSINGCSITNGKVYNAVYNDYAECFIPEETLDTTLRNRIVQINLNEKVELANENSETVIGILSDSYGHMLGGDEEEIKEGKKVPIGLAGTLYVDSEDIIDIKNIGKYIYSGDEGFAKVTTIRDSKVVGKIIGVNKDKNQYKVIICL